MCTLPLPLSSGPGVAADCTATELEQFDPRAPTTITAPKCDSEMTHACSSHLSSSRKLQLVLCSMIVIRRTGRHLLSLSPQHPLLRSITVQIQLQIAIHSDSEEAVATVPTRRNCLDSAFRVAQIALSHLQRYPSPEDPPNRPHS
jgi:hypothetical protein